jgi:hypothetical protein
VHCVLQVLRLGSVFGCFGEAFPCVDWQKATAPAPARHHVHWHSHNASAVDAWLVRQERMLRGEAPAVSQNAMMWMSSGMAGR